VLLVGYTLSGQDNDAYMFSKTETVERCVVCGYRLKFLAFNPSYEAGNSKADFAATFDGFWIVSLRFKEFCLAEEYKDLSFGEFEKDKKHFNFGVSRIVEFDALKRQTRFENFCSACGNYESVIGATPSYLLISDVLKDGFYRSDLLFGSGDEKHPLIFVGIETKAKLENTGLIGLEFSEAFGKREDI